MGSLQFNVSGKSAYNKIVASNGANQPMIGSVTYPSGYYDSSTNKTWICWEGWDTARREFVRVYDHTTNTAGGTYVIANSPLVNDSHGAPAISKGPDGHFYCLFGTHETPHNFVSSTTNVGDETSWTARAQVGSPTGEYTFFKLLVVDSELWFFCSAKGGDTEDALALFTATTSGGVPTWTAQPLLLSWGSGHWNFTSEIIDDGTFLHVTACDDPDADTRRHNVYYFKINRSTLDVTNIDGSVTVLAANLPINLTTADSSFKVIDQPTNFGSVASLVLDNSNNAHIAYIDGSSSPFPIKYINWNGSVWSTPITVDVIQGPASGYIEEFQLAFNPAGNLELWYPKDPANAFTHGGNMTKRVLLNGSWQAQETIMPYVTNAVARPVRINKPHSDIYMLFAENTQDLLDSDAGGLRIWAYGQHGLVDMS